jgi:hypothetical protein
MEHRPGSSGITGIIWPLHEEQKVKIVEHMNQCIAAETFPNFPTSRRIRRARLSPFGGARDDPPRPSLLPRR